MKCEEFNKLLSYHPYILFENGYCKVYDEPFHPRLNCLHAFFGFFQLGLSCKRVMVLMCLPG